MSRSAATDKVGGEEFHAMSALDPVSSNVIRLPLGDGAARRFDGDGRAAAFIPTRLGTLADIDYLRGYDSGIYRDLDCELTLDYMRRRFVAPLAKHLDINAATMLDCAAGFGWLSFAYLLAGGKHAVLVEMDDERLDAARAIASRLGVERRCTFVPARIQDIDLGDDGVDIFASVETLEHVGRENIGASIRNMARTASRAVVLTTPNFLFPKVAHDTELPLAHWLPAGLRRRYAASKGRAAMDRGNQFLLPWHLAPLAAKFRPISRYQTFETATEYDRFYPHYMPYGAVEAQRYRTSPKRGQRALHRALAATLGRYSFALAPNLASVWLRRE
ncbi:MAG: class I SAM-dependent methyltransferase [Stellaceae bacterium]